MTGSLDIKRKQRFDFMSCVYSRTDASEDGLIDIETIAREIGLSDGETFLIAQYLAKEDLIQLRLRHIVSITHRGIVEVEAALRRPDTSTEHFPPIQAISQNGDGAISLPPPPVSETQPGFRAPELAAIRPFLAALELQIPKLRLDPELAAEFQADVVSARVQLSSPRPKRQVVTLCLESVMAALDKAGIVNLTTDLQVQLPAIRTFLQQ